MPTKPSAVSASCCGPTPSPCCAPSAKPQASCCEPTPAETTASVPASTPAAPKAQSDTPIAQSSGKASGLSLVDLSELRKGTEDKDA